MQKEIKRNKGVISLVASQSHILKKDVFLIDDINSGSKEKMNHLKATYFVRPTTENMALLQNELKNPRFKEYYLCKERFSSEN